MESLSPRQQSILNRIVEAHIETAQPIGSRFLTDLYRGIYQGTYSSATVRHEMGLLERKGYLTHPHTSAGRVPTDRGYRYYVDHSLTAETFPPSMTEALLKELARASEEIEVLAEDVSRKLSELTGEVSAVVLEGDGASGRACRLFVQGSSRVLDKPEFQDLAKCRDLLRAFEEKMKFAAWLLSRQPGNRVSVSIGRENDAEIFHECSVVVTEQKLQSGRRAMVAVLGPLRMRYARTVPLVEQMGRIVKRLMEEQES